MRRLFSVVLAALLLAAAGAGIAPAPAMAASGYCTGTGINVVVDFGALGGGVQKGCAAGSGSRSAASAFVAAGVTMTRVSRFPGAICKVDGVPSTSCTNMPPGDAYWGLFWSHGHGWTFSSQGVDSLRLSPGDTAAFAWQTSSRHLPATSPGTAAPSAKPSTSGGKTTGSHAPSPSVAALPTSPSAPAATKTSRPRASSGDTPGSASPSTSPTTTASTGDSPAYSSNLTVHNESSKDSDDSGGLPWWVPVGIVVVLAAGGTGVVVARRRSDTGSSTGTG